MSTAIDRHKSAHDVPEQPFEQSERSETQLACPWCQSPHVEQVAAIGSHLMVAQYICLACHSPFERIRR